METGAHLEHDHSPLAVAKRLGDGPPVSHLRDWIYGGIDGAVTTFAIVAGALGADLSTRFVIIMGIANMVADGFSMAAANYTSTQAEKDNHERVRAMEERHILLDPEGEHEELRQIYARKGFEGEDLDALVDLTTKRKRHWIDVMMAEEHGLAPIERSANRAAVTTFVAFVACGSIPLIPFIFLVPQAGLWALLATGLTFFLIGTVKARWSLAPWWRSGLATLAIGMTAAGIAFLLGEGLANLI